MGTSSIPTSSSNLQKDIQSIIEVEDNQEREQEVSSLSCMLREWRIFKVNCRSLSTKGLTRSGGTRPYPIEWKVTPFLLKHKSLNSSHMMVKDHQISIFITSFYK